MSQIINAADLNTYTNKTLVPGLANQVVDAVNQWIETRTKRCWGETKTVTERYDWKRTFWLRHQDVTEITSIKLGWPGQTQTTIASNSYWNNAFGRVTMFPSLIGPVGGINNTSMLLNDYMEVEYTYGVEVVPEDLFLATLGVATEFYNFAINGQQTVVAASVGSYRLEYIGAVRGTAGPGAQNPAINAAEANFQVIDSYRTQRV